MNVTILRTRRLILASALTMFWTWSLYYSGYLGIIFPFFSDGAVSEQEPAGLRWEFASYSFGDVYLGDSPHNTFVLFNDTDEDQKVRVISGCGCARLTHVPEMVRAHGSSALVIEMSARVSGKRSSSIVAKPVNDTACSAKAFEVTCNFKPLFRLDPPTIALDIVHNPRASINLRCEPKVGKLTLSSFASSSKLFHTSLDSLDDGNAYRLTVSCVKHVPSGRVIDELTAAVSGSVQSTLSIPVVLVNEGSLRAEPAVLDLPPSRKDPLSFVVRIIHQVGLFKILDAPASNEYSATFKAEALSPSELRLEITNFRLTGHEPPKRVVVRTSAGDLAIPVKL